MTDNVFLPQIYIKVKLLKTQNATELDSKTSAISVIFIMTGFTCRPKHLIQKFPTVRSYVKKVIGGGGGWNKNVLG